MEEIDNLIEDYNKKIETLQKQIEIMSTKDVNRYTRLVTKQSCYRTFVVELERLKSKV